MTKKTPYISEIVSKITSMIVDVELLADLPCSPIWLLVMSLRVQFLIQNASEFGLWILYYSREHAGFLKSEEVTDIGRNHYCSPYWFEYSVIVYSANGLSINCDKRITIKIWLWHCFIHTGTGCSHITKLVPLAWTIHETPDSFTRPYFCNGFRLAAQARSGVQTVFPTGRPV